MISKTAQYEKSQMSQSTNLESDVILISDAADAQSYNKIDIIARIMAYEMSLSIRTSR